MKQKIFLLLLSVSVFSSCMWGDHGSPPTGYKRDTLAFKYQTFISGKIVRIKYPLFTQDKALNDTLTNRILSLYNSDDKKANSLKQLSDQFMADFHRAMADNNAFDKLNIDATILRQDSSFTTIQMYSYVYTGGAHGNSSIHFINWNSKKHQAVKLADIMIANYEKPLVAIGEQLFRKEENLSDSASLVPNYFFKSGKFSLPGNYLITPLGISFLYNDYEIKPYAAGVTRLFIPYSKIQSLLKPNTVVSQYFK